MVSSSLAYAIEDALKSVRDNPVTVLLSSLTVGFSLAITAFFFVMTGNMEGVVKTWGERAHVVAYFSLGAKVDGDAAVAEIRKIQGVKDVVFVSEDKALAALKEELKGHESVLEGVGRGNIPASVEIKLKPEYINKSGVERIALSVSKLPLVDDVQYGEEWVERFSGFLKFFKIFAYSVGIFLIGATIFIISNTIRLSVYARRDEIEVMRYLGAANSFIKTPFVLEGLVAGAIGGALALLILFAGRTLLLHYIPPSFAFMLDSPFSTFRFLISLVCSGLVIGGAGSLLSLGRFLKV